MNEIEKLSPIPEKELTNPEGMVDIRSRQKVEVPRKVESWMDKLEDDPQIAQKTITDDTGQTILKPIAPINPKVTLPVPRTTFVHGFKKSVSEAGRWLSEFVFRLIKIQKGNVKFKEE